MSEMTRLRGLHQSLLRFGIAAKPKWLRRIHIEWLVLHLGCGVHTGDGVISTRELQDLNDAT